VHRTVTIGPNFTFTTHNTTHNFGANCEYIYEHFDICLTSSTSKESKTYGSTTRQGDDASHYSPSVSRGEIRRTRGVTWKMSSLSVSHHISKENHNKDYLI
jgi:hypothetical protein